MEKYLKILFFPLLIFFTASSCFSQGLNALIAFDTLNVYAFGNSGKVMTTTNGGNSWSRFTVASTDFLCADNTANFMFAGGNDGKVYIATRPSTTFTSYPTGSFNALTGIAVYGFNAIYACSDSGKVFKSTNLGVTWTLKNSGIPNVKLNAISFRDESTGIAVGNGGAAYKTTNGGTNWTAITTGTTRNLLTVTIKVEEYFIGGEWGIFLHGGVSGTAQSEIWDLKTTGDINSVKGSGLFSLHLVGGGGFIRNNMGPTGLFFGNFEINPLMASLSDIDFVELSGNLYACSKETDVIIKSTNYGTSWQLTAGASGNIVWEQKLSASGGIGNNLCLNPNNRNELYVVYGKNIYRSMNRGDNWVQIATVGSSTGTVTYAHSFYVSPLDTSIMICAIEGSPNDQIVRSTNYGLTWTTIISKNFSNYGTPLEMDQNNPSTFYFAPDGGEFWKSTDNGATFNSISAYPFRSPCDILVKWGNSNEILVADGVTSASQPADIFRSTDGGVVWTKVHTNAGGSGLSEIPSMCNTVFNPLLSFCTNWSGSSRYKTTNGGVNWTSISATSFSGWASDICREDPNVILTGNYGQNSSLSTDGGTTWTAYPMPSGGCGAGMIVPQKNYLIAMQCNGLLKMKIQYDGALIVDEKVLSTVPVKYSLHQNYPNPFNPSTEIRYDLLKAGDVSITVYDQAGKKISEVINSYKNAGSYSVKFDGSNLASGVYYYTLNVNGNTFTKKMMLVK